MQYDSSSEGSTDDGFYGVAPHLGLEEMMRMMEEGEEEEEEEENEGGMPTAFIPHKLITIQLFLKNLYYFIVYK